MASSSGTSSSNIQTISSLPSLSPTRIQSLKTFLASDEPITILPSFSYKSPLNFLLTQPDEENEAIPPLRPGNPTTVPLWLALYLRKRNLCRLVCPEWMTVSKLKSILAHERDPNQENFSQELPFRHAEIARAVLQAVGASRSAVHAAASGSGSASAAEEVPQAEVVRVLLEDISMVRMDKIRRNFHAMSSDIMGKSLEMPMSILDVTGIGSLEMAAVKPFLEKAFEDHLKFVRAGIAEKGDGNGGGDGDGGDGSKRVRNMRLSSSRRPRRPPQESSSSSSIRAGANLNQDPDADPSPASHAEDQGDNAAIHDFELPPDATMDSVSQQQHDGEDTNANVDTTDADDNDHGEDTIDAEPTVSKSRIRRYR